MYVYRLTMIGIQSNVVQDVRITKSGNEYQNVSLLNGEGRDCEKWWGANRNLMKLNTKLGSHKNLYRSKWMIILFKNVSLWKWLDFYACRIQWYVYLIFSLKWKWYDDKLQDIHNLRLQFRMSPSNDVMRSTFVLWNIPSSCLLGEFQLLSLYFFS